MTRTSAYAVVAMELCLLTQPTYSSSQGEALDTKKHISFAAADQTVLQSLIQVGLNGRIPLGIVLNATGELCTPQKNRTMTNTAFKKVLSALLDDSGYWWFVRDGVIEIEPKEMPEPARQVLNVHFDRFGSIKTTIKGMGIVLSGQIFAHFHPGQGYALDILASPDAEEVPMFSLLNVSAEQALNYVVSTGSNGIWILSPPAEASKEDYGRLNTYGYKDDVVALGRVSCPQSPGRTP